MARPMPEVPPVTKTDLLVMSKKLWAGMRGTSKVKSGKGKMLSTLGILDNAVRGVSGGSYEF